MNTHQITFTTDTTTSEAAGPLLRELTYRYHPKRDAAGKAIRLGAAMQNPRIVAATLTTLLADEAVEVFGILCLTTRHRVICWHEVSRGCLNSTVVHPREVFKAAILANAAAILLAHNHPSGDPQPSGDDFELTTRLVAAGALVGIDVLDHLVIGDGSFVSFRETGRL